MNVYQLSSSGKHLYHTARYYASAVLAMGLCPSVSVTSRSSTKTANTGSHKQHRTIAQGFLLSDAKDLLKIRTGSPPTRAPNAGGVGQKSATFD